MKKFFILAFLVIFSTIAQAATYKGIIADVYDGGQSVKLNQVDELTKETKSFVVSITEKTRINGAKSAADLKPGDVVYIDATETEYNRLDAQDITVAGNP